MVSVQIIRKFPGARNVPTGRVFVQGAGGYLDGVECEFAVAVKTGPGDADYEAVAYVFSEAHALLFAKALAAVKQEGA